MDRASRTGSGWRSACGCRPTRDVKPVSAILDSVPYRKSDGTAIGDAAWATYFASHGFAFARVDLRGSGDSSGLLVDEYTEQEQLDTERVIEWLATRPWSSGSVGMIGVSWGGFAALQMAARSTRAPPRHRPDPRRPMTATPTMSTTSVGASHRWT